MSTPRLVNHLLFELGLLSPSFLLDFLHQLFRKVIGTLLDARVFFGEGFEGFPGLGEFHDRLVFFVVDNVFSQVLGHLESTPELGVFGTQIVGRNKASHAGPRN